MVRKSLLEFLCWLRLGWVLLFSSRFFICHCRVGGNPEQKRSNAFAKRALNSTAYSLCLLCLFLSSSTELWAQESSNISSAKKTPVAQIEGVLGPVEKVAEGKQNYLKPQDQLYAGDLVRNSDSAKCSFNFLAGGNAFLGRSSHFKIPASPEKADSFILLRGALRIDWPKDALTPAKIDSRTGVVKVEAGSSCLIEVYDAFTVATCLKGNVLLDGKVYFSSSAGKAKRLKAGQQSRVREKELPLKAMELPDNWIQGLRFYSNLNRSVLNDEQLVEGAMYATQAIDKSFRFFLNKRNLNERAQSLDVLMQEEDRQRETYLRELMREADIRDTGFDFALPTDVPITKD